MSIAISDIEFDFLGDLTNGEHILWELFGFIRLHEPQLQQANVIQRAEHILLSWLERGWIVIRDSTGATLSGPQLTDILQKRRNPVDDAYSAEIIITDKGRSFYFSLPPRSGVGQ